MPDGDHNFAQTDKTAALILADGSVFLGYGVGSQGETIGEVCFNTSITGYQEILTDPSYTGQIITFTFPHIGNVGTNDEDFESTKVAASGLILREAITNPSNFRSTAHLNDWLKQHGITGISGIDTRALTRHIRSNGAQNAAIVYVPDVIGDAASLEAVVTKLSDHPSMQGLELTKQTTCEKPRNWKQGTWQLSKGYAKQGGDAKDRLKVIALDYGAKDNILRCLAQAGCDVTAVPSGTSANDIIKENPDGVFLSNGPGDPEATAQYAIEPIRELVDAKIPTFGICMGHQLLARALGCETIKMQQGHRGSNHPVQDLQTKKVEITSQNHGFVVNSSALPEDVEVTHLSLFDQTIEGIRSKSKPAFSVQYHPEASPGPTDSHYLFDRFVELMKKNKKK